MTEGSAFSHIVTFAFPLFIGSALQELYVLADAMIASHYIGEQGLAAIGSVSAISSMLISFAIGVNHGFSLHISRAFGADNIKELKRCTTVMVVLDLILSLVLTVLSLLFIKGLLVWLKTPSDIFSMAYIYIFVSLAGLSATVLYNMCAGYLRSLGNSRVPLYFLILSSFLNIVLDLLFICTLKMGVEGAALATVISQLLSATLSIIYIVKVYPDYMPKGSERKVRLPLYLDMLATGISVGIMSSVYHIGTIILQRSINALGTAIITSHTASRKMFEATNIPSSTLGQATAVFTSQNYGAGRIDRVRKGFRITYMLQIVWSLLCILFAFTCAEAFASIIANTSDPAILGWSGKYFRTCVLFYPVVALVYIFRNSLQSLGRRIVPVFSSFIELFGKIISGLFIVPVVGYQAVILTEPLTWTGMAIFLTISYFVLLGRGAFEHSHH